MSLGMTGKLILGFLLLLLGAVFTGVIATQELAVTDKSVVNDELQAFVPNGVGAINTSDTYTVTNNPTSWKIDDCPLTNIVIGNASEDFTLTTDYTITASTGVFQLLNTSTTAGSIGADNNTYVDYTYCGDDYLNSSWSRSVINLIGGFFALAVMLVGVGLFINVAKEGGIL